MKVVLFAFRFIIFTCHAVHFYLSIRQNQSLAWILGPQTLGKLMTYGNYLSIRYNQGLKWILGPQTLGKLITYDNYLSLNRTKVLNRFSDHKPWEN